MYKLKLIEMMKQHQQNGIRAPESGDLTDDQNVSRVRMID